MKKITQKEFEDRIKELTDGKFNIISPYINTNQKIKLVHECGFEFETIPTNFYKNLKCPKCSGSIRNKTTNIFKSEVKSLCNDEYKVLSEYEANKKKVKFLHKTCGHIFEMKPNDFLYGHRCPNCFGAKKKTTDLFNKEVDTLTNGEYSIVSEYESAMKKVKILHNECGYIFEMKPNSFVNGCRCPSCAIEKRAKVNRKTHDEFLSSVFNLVGDEYLVSSNSSYFNNKTKILFKHTKCNSEFKMAAANFLAGQRCPCCSESKGEKQIEIFLLEKKINFQKQYTFENLKRKRFDFLILDSNNKIKFVLEYDGEFHFKPFSNTKRSLEKFERQKLSDKEKDNFCLKNKISLFRIPYWYFDNIEEILESILKMDNFIVMRSGFEVNTKLAF